MNQIDLSKKKKKKTNKQKNTETKCYDCRAPKVESNAKRGKRKGWAKCHLVVFCSIVFYLIPGVLCAKGQHGYGRNDPQAGD